MLIARAPQPRMPFGQHKGEYIADLPDDYLDWLLTIELHGWLESAVCDEIERREELAELREAKREERRERQRLERERADAAQQALAAQPPAPTERPS